MAPFDRDGLRGLDALSQVTVRVRGGVKPAVAGASSS